MWTFTWTDKLDVHWSISSPGFRDNVPVTNLPHNLWIKLYISVVPSFPFSTSVLHFPPLLHPFVLNVSHHNHLHQTLVSQYAELHLHRKVGRPLTLFPRQISAITTILSTHLKIKSLYFCIKLVSCPIWSTYSIIGLLFVLLPPTSLSTITIVRLRHLNTWTLLLHIFFKSRGTNCDICCKGFQSKSPR